MISDAYVRFECEECGAEEEVILPVMYRSYAGTCPHADLRDEALANLLPREWLMVGEKVYCEDCNETAAKP